MIYNYVLSSEKKTPNEKTPVKVDITTTSESCPNLNSAIIVIVVVISSVQFSHSNLVTQFRQLQTSQMGMDFPHTGQKEKKQGRKKGNVRKRGKDEERGKRGNPINDREI